MNKRLALGWKLLWGMIFIAVASLAFASCGQPSESGLGEERQAEYEKEYEKAVSDFVTALAASETDEARFAFNKMNDVALAFPEEPAAWGNLGMMAMRQGNVDLARDRMAKARELAPDHPAILEQSAILESRFGRASESVGFLEHALAQAEGDSPLIAFMLAEELEREGSEASVRRARVLMDSLQVALPENWVLPLESMRLAASDGDWNVVAEYLKWYERAFDGGDAGNVGTETPEVPAEARQSIRAIRRALETESYAGLPLEISLLRTYLQSTAKFEADLRIVKRPETNLGFLIEQFLVLPAPQWNASPPDRTIRFTPDELDGSPSSMVQWAEGVALFEGEVPFPVVVSGGRISLGDAGTLPFPGSDPQQAIRQEAVQFFDINNDFRTDLVMTGPDGVVLYVQQENQTFVEQTQALREGGLPAEEPFHSSWAVDIDMDGDLDLLLSASGKQPLLLRNGGDGSYVARRLFDGVRGVDTFFWADLDGDGPPEAIMKTEAGTVFVAWNLRGGAFSDVTEIETARALEVADIDANGAFELLMLLPGNRLTSASYQRETENWTLRTLAESVFERVDGRANSATEELEGTFGDSPNGPPLHELFVADLDNNGSLDLLVRAGSNHAVLLGSADHGELSHQTEFQGGMVRSLFDVEGDDRLDLLFTDAEGRLRQFDNTGTAGYHGTSIRARASGEQGDQRINSFGIGGEIEIRAGYLYQKRQIRAPLVHFGLGTYEETDVLRIIWPNGSVQTGFSELGAGSTIFNEQILKGSCPWLFVSDGEEMHFVTDILWRSPLGLRINATHTAGVLQTFDRVRIPPNRLKPVDGHYELRVTAELWETHFFDHVGLMATDHPEGTHVWVDERFVFPPPDLGLRLSGPLTPVRRVVAREDLSSGDWTDQTETTRELDQNYARAFVKSRYQGLVQPHEVLIELEEGMESDLLILSGWLRPTDSSLNLALSQGSVSPPSGLKIEIDRGDGWVELHADYGIPAGKLKTILVDLPVLDGEGTGYGVAGGSKGESRRYVKRVRLTTTSEIYWDRIAQSTSMDAATIHVMDVPWTDTELRYRGFSEWYRSDESSPKLGRYASVSGTRQRWRDLEGFHTRFGDVNPLLAETDERYVIMSAGDELVLRAGEVEQPAMGLQRTFFFDSDGWVKDGDYNTEASATVHPLPSRLKSDVDYRPGTSLFSDPVFELHASDWAEYHTRYITPYAFERALRGREP